VPSARERRPTGRRVLKFGAGVALTAVGVPLLVLPGPGLLAVGGGLALMSDEIPALRRARRAIAERARRARER
jgi:Putative transmembrane protein (PGPGW)